MTQVPAVQVGETVRDLNGNDHLVIDTHMDNSLTLAGGYRTPSREVWTKVEVEPNVSRKNWCPTCAPEGRR